MTATLVGDEQLHAAAIIARLNATLPASVRAYDSDDVPDVKPDKYVEVIVTRRFGANLRSSGRTAAAGWRVACRSVDQTSVANARHTANYVRTALEFYRVTVSSKKSTPIQFETEDPIGPDDGWYSGLSSWTYVL